MAASRAGWRLRQWPLGVKLAAAFLVPLVLAVGQAAVAYRTLTIDQDAGTLVDHTYQVIAAADDAKTELTNLRRNYTDYVLAGNRTYLDQYQASKKAYAVDLAELETLTADNPPQADRWRQIQTLADTWVSQTAEPDVEQKRIAGESAAASQSILVGSLSTSQARFDAINAIFGDAANAEQGLLAQRSKAAADADLLLEQTLLGGIALIGASALLLAIVLSTSIGGAFRRLVRAADHLAAGDLETRVPVTRGDEIGRAGEAFNAMADRMQVVVGDLQDQVGQRQQAEAALQESHEKLTEWIGELERRDRESSVMAETAELLQACVTLHEAHEVIAGVLPRLFPEHPVAVCAINDSRNLVEVVAQSDPHSATQRAFGPDECWALRLGRSHRAVKAAGTVQCSHVAQPPPAVSLCVPMSAQGNAVGLLHVTFSSDSAGGEASFRAVERLAASLADQVGLALANLKLRETLRTQALRDPLTGLFNRRYLEESLEREISRAQRRHSPLSVLMLDIDHFKNFNDTFGHQVGDEVLRQVAHVLLAEIRTSDLACRYGGEEFTLILPDAEPADAKRRADHIREAIAQMPLSTERKTYGQVTLSFGVAGYPSHGQNLTELIHAADAALYSAKNNGRNRVEIAATGAPSPVQISNEGFPASSTAPVMVPPA